MKIVPKLLINDTGTSYRIPSSYKVKYESVTSYKSKNNCCCILQYTEWEEKMWGSITPTSESNIITKQ